MTQKVAVAAAAWRPQLAAAAVGIQVGAAIVATRYVVQETGPTSLAMLRYLVGFLCLLPLVLLGPKLRLQWADVPAICLLGIVQFGVLILLLNIGLQQVTSARAALLFATAPLMTLVLAASLGREALTPAKLLGVLTSLLGVALTLGGGLLSGAGGAYPWLGVLAVLASALCAATCSIFYRPYLLRYPVLPLSALAMLASVGFLAMASLFEGDLPRLAEVSLGGWSAILFIGVSSGVGYALWLWALGRATPTRVTVFLSLSPVTAAALGTLLLGEALSLSLLLGILCVGLGIWLAHREQRPRPAGGLQPGA